MAIGRELGSKVEEGGEGGKGSVTFGSRRWKMEGRVLRSSGPKIVDGRILCYSNLKHRRTGYRRRTSHLHHRADDDLPSNLRVRKS